jgi:hypothetical protein
VAALLAASATAAPAPPAGPSATSLPFVSGIAAAGNRLTGLSGGWTGTGAIAYRYQWFRCNAAGASCASILGATSATYELATRDVGKTLGFTVYASDATGTAAASASLVGPVASIRPLLVSTLQPVVDGVPAVGQQLSATTGTWSPLPSSYGYTWERCNGGGRQCIPIPGAGARSYRVAALDLGHALVALVRATNATTTQDAFSIATPPVVGASVHGPTPLAPPAITGSPLGGSRLIAATGRWHGVGPLSFAFQWYRCDPLGGNCAPVRGATAAAYRLGAADAGEAIGLTLRASDLTGTTVAYASLVGPVPTQSALTATSAPTISAAGGPGDALTVTPGSWSTSPSTYTYTWLLCDVAGRGCSSIPHATGASYTPTAADGGHTIVAQVAASAGGATQAALSAAIAAAG